jgi:glycosyltransferase involved in cell wall biosynthesis
VPIVLDTPVAREIYGAAAWRVPDGPALTTDVATAMAALLDDDAQHARFRAEAAPVLARYDWAETARQALGCLEEAAGA